MRRAANASTGRLAPRDRWIVRYVILRQQSRFSTDVITMMVGGKDRRELQALVQQGFAHRIGIAGVDVNGRWAPASALDRVVLERADRNHRMRGSEFMVVMSMPVSLVLQN